MNAVHRYVLFGRRSLDGAAERGALSRSPGTAG